MKPAQTSAGVTRGAIAATSGEIHTLVGAGATFPYPLYAKCVELDLPIFVTAGVPGPRVPMALLVPQALTVTALMPWPWQTALWGPRPNGLHRW